MNNKCIGLLSGGLDSTLAVTMMHTLGFDITLLNFMSPFCTCTPKSSGCKSEAVKISKKLNIPIKVESFGQEYINMIKSPDHGYGKNMNPCLDCRIMMYKRSAEIMKEIGASFIFTGEVIGQRPMSQRRDSMSIVERESGLKGLILRPLCAKLMNPTLPEIEGIVDREKLLDISGRSRKRQMTLAQDYDVLDYPCPSGGCLLTEVNFANRVRDLMKHSDTPTVNDARLLRVGRHFRISDSCKVIVGRNEDENNRLENMMKDGDYSCAPVSVSGPFVLIKGDLKGDSINTIAGLTSRYCKSLPEEEVKLLFSRFGFDENKELTSLPLDEDLITGMIV